MLRVGCGGKGLGGKTAPGVAELIRCSLDGGVHGHPDSVAALNRTPVLWHFSGVRKPGIPQMATDLPPSPPLHLQVYYFFTVVG